MKVSHYNIYTPSPPIKRNPIKYIRSDVNGREISAERRERKHKFQSRKNEIGPYYVSLESQ